MISNVQAKQYEINIMITSLPPWIVVQKSKCFSGPICKLYNELNKDQNITVKFKVSSLARVNLATYEGRVDAAVFPKLPIFEKYYKPVSEYMKYKLGYYSIKHKGRRVNCTTSKNPHKEKGIKYIEVPSLKQCFQMLREKRVTDILLTDVELHDFLIQNNEFKVGTFYSVKDLSLWFYLNKKFSKEALIYIKSKFESLL